MREIGTGTEKKLLEFHVQDRKSETGNATYRQTEREIQIMRVRLLRVTETIFERDRQGTERIKQA